MSNFCSHNGVSIIYFNIQNSCVFSYSYYHCTVCPITKIINQKEKLSEIIRRHTKKCYLLCNSSIIKLHHHLLLKHSPFQVIHQIQKFNWTTLNIRNQSKQNSHTDLNITTHSTVLFFVNKSFFLCWYQKVFTWILTRNYVIEKWKSYNLW